VDHHAFHTHRITLGALSLAAILAFSTPVAMAQIGPPDPSEKAQSAPTEPTPMDQIKNSFFKLFKKPEEGDKAKNEDALPSSKMNPYGTTVPDISDPASDRTVPRPRTESAGKGGKQPPKETPKAPARPPLLSQPPLPEAKVAQPVISEENPPVKLVTLDNPANPLGFADAESKLNQIDILIKNQQLVSAKQQLTPLRQWLVDSTEAHLSLYKALGNVSSARAQAELEKHLALQFALLRDRAMFQMGSINVAEKNYKSAIKDLTEVIKSQPRSEMGLKSYQMLQEIGFTEKLQLAE
jgi:hypothetical protein